MGSAVRCLVDHGDRHALVRLVGELDVAGSAAVRTALLKCLAEQPEAVVIDVSRLRVDDPTALTVFLAVARQAARWPMVPLTLVAPTEDTARALRARGVERRIPVHPGIAEAVQGLSIDGGRPSITEELLPIAGAGRRARELVTEACLRWDLSDQLGAACTVVTELVNNVVQHAHTMMTLRLCCRNRYLDIAVRDGSDQPPVLRSTDDPTALHGRGLALVAATAYRWGHLPCEDGKVVWAVLSRGGGRLPAPR